MKKDLLGNRRHRLHAVELNPVLTAVEHRLRLLAEDRTNLLEAEILFRVLWRFRENKHGRPSYPDPITWRLIEDMIKGPFIDQPTLEAVPRIEEGE